MDKRSWLRVTDNLPPPCGFDWVKVFFLTTGPDLQLSCAETERARGKGSIFLPAPGVYVCNKLWLIQSLAYGTNDGFVFSLHNQLSPFGRFLPGEKGQYLLHLPSVTDYWKDGPMCWYSRAGHTTTLPRQRNFVFRRPFKEAVSRDFRHLFFFMNWTHLGPW